jgi:hypothetical protein
VSEELYNFVAFKADGSNFDELNSGGLYEMHAVATLNLGAISTLT